jgi:maleate cis-trans isomerase
MYSAVLKGIRAFKATNIALFTPYNKEIHMTNV